jgi:hypothetical protein
LILGAVGGEGVKGGGKHEQGNLDFHPQIVTRDC